MTIPDFQSVMLPLMNVASDKAEHTFADTVGSLAKEFGLTEAERKELLPSGKQARFDNRIGWALTYLKKAKLLESSSKGKFQITARGVSALGEEPTRIDMKFLERYEEYREFKKKSKRKTTPKKVDVENPEELLEFSHQALMGELAEELLTRIKENSDSFFENLVLDLLVAMGYGGSKREAAEAVGGPGDEGIDGIIKQDQLGLDVIYVQAKKWEGSVGRPVVQAFAGSLEGKRASRGVLITTSDFSRGAREYVRNIGKKIVLIDGYRLAELMIDHAVGVSEQTRYILSKIDEDYFPQ